MIDNRFSVQLGLHVCVFTFSVLSVSLALGTMSSATDCQDDLSEHNTTSILSQEPVRLRDLSGTWLIRLDPNDIGMTERWFAGMLGERIIELPGTTDQAEYGDRIDKSIWMRSCERTMQEVDFHHASPPHVVKNSSDIRRQGHLVREHAYLGKAWYQRTIEVPEQWSGLLLELELERVIWRSDVWIGDRYVGSCDSLVGPHQYELGELSPGVHRLTIRVDNGLIHNIGIVNHAYGPHTQSRWNGIVGDIVVRARPTTSLRGFQSFPAEDGQSVRVRARVDNTSDRAVDAKLSFVLEPEAGGNAIANLERILCLLPGEHEIDVVLRTDDPVPLWDEFNPALHRIRASITSQAGTHRVENVIGFRSIERQGRAIVINGRRVFLRGTLDCAVYPLTGHPPMSQREWMLVMKQIKEHGFNHVRYHSWCPPRAAFDAADRLGLYLMPEPPLWIDQWITETGTQPVLFGEDPKVVAFIEEELNRMLRVYGHHASFLMLGLGNEISPASDWTVLNEMLLQAKQRDPRRLYTVSAARKRAAADDFWVTHHTSRFSARGFGAPHPHNNWDFKDAVEDVSVPLVAHETGQRPVFPHYASLLPKFTGPLKPYNLELYRDMLSESGMAALNEQFTHASGRFMLVQYKAEHEGILRTPGYAGFQLLMLNDFTGQGQAHVGILDPFWETKGIISADSLRRWNAPTVPLARFEQYTWTSDQTFDARIDVSHFGPADLVDVTAQWRIANASREVLASGKLSPRDIPTGFLTTLGSITIPLDVIAAPQAVNLEVTIENAAAVNDWNVWVYPPAHQAIADGDVTVVTSYEQAKPLLAREQKVLLLAHGLANERTRRGTFESVYWSTAWGGGKEGTLGILCDPRHPALAMFPTAEHGDWQWRELTAGATVFDLQEVADAADAIIVRRVPDFHQCKQLADVFEVRVDNGQLLVCGYDLSNDLSNRHAARQMLRSLLAYMNSDAFNPKHAFDVHGLLQNEGEMRDVR